MKIIQKRFLLIIVPTALLLTTALFSFSIFTNSEGYARRYLDSDIPFVYQLNNTTPSEYVGPIDAGAQVWEDVVSSYWEFDNGGFTPASNDGLDGINLIFFDFQGINFTPGTNTIAYSRTWTSGFGASYHAVESDLIWNARDFPPSPVGASGQQDLQSVIAHELGHHLGLGHAGPAGGPPGVGPLIVAATMYGFSSSGDTTKRSLHIDDIAGVSAIYPVWKIQGNVTNLNTGLPFEGVALTSDTIFAAEVFAPIFSNNNYQRPGYYRDTISVASDGSYDATILKQNFDLSAVYFGYQTVSTSVLFNNPGGIGQTEIIDVDFQMQLNPLATISGIIVDSANGNPINAAVRVLVVSNKPGKPVGFIADTTTSPSGDFQIELPVHEDYMVLVRPEPPYPEASYYIGDLPEIGTSVEFKLLPADILLVNDDPSQNYEEEFAVSITSNNLTYHAWRTSTDGIPDSTVFEKFVDSKIVIWFTGDANDSVLSLTEQQSLIKLLELGGKLVLTGQNIAEKSDSIPFIKDYVGVTFDKNVVSPITSGIAGDPITAGLIVSTVGGAGNQNSRDAFQLHGNAEPILNYGTAVSLGVAGVRNENNQLNWKLVCMGFGLEGVNNTAGVRDTLLSRILAWFESPTGIWQDNKKKIVSIPYNYELSQNYPNPFNSTTVINYSLRNESIVHLEIYDIIGRKIKTVINKKQEPGEYSVYWNGKNEGGIVVSTGIYFYRLKAGSYEKIRKMILVE